MAESQDMKARSEKNLGTSHWRDVKGKLAEPRALGDHEPFPNNQFSIISIAKSPLLNAKHKFTIPISYGDFNGQYEKFAD